MLCRYPGGMKVFSFRHLSAGLLLLRPSPAGMLKEWVSAFFIDEYRSLHNTFAINLSHVVQPCLPLFPSRFCLFFLLLIGRSVFHFSKEEVLDHIARPPITPSLHFTTSVNYFRTMLERCMPNKGDKSSRIPDGQRIPTSKVQAQCGPRTRGERGGRVSLRDAFPESLSTSALHSAQLLVCRSSYLCLAPSCPLLQPRHLQRDMITTRRRYTFNANKLGEYAEWMVNGRRIAGKRRRKYGIYFAACVPFSRSSYLPHEAHAKTLVRQRDGSPTMKETLHENESDVRQVRYGATSLSLDTLRASVFSSTQPSSSSSSPAATSLPPQ